MPALRDTRRFAGHAPDRERPIGGYAALIGAFSSLAAGFGVWFRRSGRELPERMSARDLALLTVASHKAARTLAADRVASVVRAPFTEFEDDAGPGEVSERARGRGLRRAVGELLVCPFCLGMWTSELFTGGLLVWPRATRWMASVWTIFFGSEMLQIAYKRAENTLTG
ncbi:MAG TPA: DUF1360 domain-containing protein [Solirubrobacteraceae bacterium]|nr:DUF1360 domain-containing protein [Solirubrobacteraceae bacterium]